MSSISQEDLDKLLQKQEIERLNEQLPDLPAPARSAAYTPPKPAKVEVVDGIQGTQPDSRVDLS